MVFLPDPLGTKAAARIARSCESPATSVALLAVVLLVSGCGGSQQGRSADTDYLEEGETSGVDRFMPLYDGLVYQYDTTTSRGEKGAMSIQVMHTRRGIVDVQFGGRLEHLRVDGKGIRFVDGGFLLKPPLSDSSSWEGRFGIVKVTSLDQEVTVPAGKFTGCASTLEKGSGIRAAWHVTSTFCPEVGLVTIDLQREEGTRELAVLRSFGPRVDPMVNEQPAPPEK